MSKYVIAHMNSWYRNFWNGLPLHDVDLLVMYYGGAVSVIIEDGQITAYEMEVEP